MTIQTAEEREEHVSTAELARQMPAANQPKDDGAPGPLLPQDYVQDLRGRWDKVQTGFVDEPRAAVQEADELVAQAIKRLAESFAEERNRLEQQWAKGGDVNTEELRIALRKYRSFFQRLLSV
jgi:hypothetical protein